MCSYVTLMKCAQMENIQKQLISMESLFHLLSTEYSFTHLSPCLEEKRHPPKRERHISECISITAHKWFETARKVELLSYQSWLQIFWRDLMSWRGLLKFQICIFLQYPLFESLKAAIISIMLISSEEVVESSSHVLTV